MQSIKNLSLALTLAMSASSVAVATALPAAAAQTISAGVVIHATSNTALNTKNATVGEPFSMTVTSPAQLSGAVIHGHVADVRSGGQGRKAYFTLAPDYLSLPSGQSATLTANGSGNVVSFDNTGARPENTTVQKAAGAGGGLLVGSQTLGRLGGVVGALGNIAGAAGGYAYANNKKPNLYIDKGTIATLTTQQSITPSYVRRRQSSY